MSFLKILSALIAHIKYSTKLFIIDFTFTILSIGMCGNKQYYSFLFQERRAMIVRQNKAAIANQQVADDENKVVQSD